MRIAFVTGEYVTESNFDGGLSNYVHRVALSLKSLGHEPIVVVASDRDECFVHKGITVYRVDISLTIAIKALICLSMLALNMTINLIYTGRALNRKVAEIHRENPLDVLQYTHLGGGALFKTINIPSIVRLSSYTPLCREQGGYEFAHPLQTMQQEFIEKLALKRADAVFGPCVIIDRIVAQVIGREVTLIESPFILDTTELDASVYQERLAGSEYLLFFGSLSVLKGLVTIAAMLHTLLQRHPRLKFVLVGKQNADYKGAPMMEYLWHQAKEDRDRVIYLGQLRHEQLYPIIANAKAVVLPSRVDNFPNTCLEAMAHKRVVIGTHGTSFEQLLVDGESGYLCDIGDPESLLAAVEKALALTDEERCRMGERAAARINELRPELIVRQLIDFYNSVISKSN